jgi:hypothetical protein
MTPAYPIGIVVIPAKVAIQGRSTDLHPDPGRAGRS